MIIYKAAEFDLADVRTTKSAQSRLVHRRTAQADNDWPLPIALIVLLDHKFAATHGLQEYVNLMEKRFS